MFGSRRDSKHDSWLLSRTKPAPTTLMASDSPPEPYHHHSKHSHGRKDRDQHHPPRLPVIPDLRFEYSYLRSIRPYVSVERISAPDARSKMNVEFIAEDDYISLGAEGKEKKLLVEDKRMLLKLQSPVSSPREIIHLQWPKIFWVTMRDQVISPFLQGALWCVLGFVYFVAKRFLIIHDI